MEMFECRDVRGELSADHSRLPAGGASDQPWKWVKYLERSHSADKLWCHLGDSFIHSVTHSFIQQTFTCLFIYPCSRD